MRSIGCGVTLAPLLFVVGREWWDPYDYLAEAEDLSPDHRHKLVLVVRMVGTIDELAIFGCRLPVEKDWQQGTQLCGWVNNIATAAWVDDDHIEGKGVRPCVQPWQQVTEWDGVRIHWQEER